MEDRVEQWHMDKKVLGSMRKRLRGRPRKYDPPPEMARAHRELWLGPRSLDEKLSIISADVGFPVYRQLMYARYGSPRSPRPQK